MNNFMQQITHKAKPIYQVLRKKMAIILHQVIYGYGKCIVAWDVIQKVDISKSSLNIDLDRDFNDLSLSSQQVKPFV